MADQPVRTTEAHEQALAAYFLATARPAAWALGGIYALLALAKSFLYAADPGRLSQLSMVDATVALTCVVTAWALGRATPADRWAHPLTTLALVVTMADSVVTMHLLFKPLETTVFLMLVLGASLIFTSRLWFHATLALNAMAWGVGAWWSHPGPMLSPGAPWVELGISLAAASVVAELVFLTRRRIYLRIEALRLAEARQRQELESAMTALQTHHEQLQTLVRFKTDFVNAVSHDLRIPLTSIKGFTELLVDKFAGPLTDQQEAYVGQIEKNAGRLERLVDDMLDFARLEAGTFHLVRHDLDFGSLVMDLAESFTPQAQDHDLSLVLALPDRPMIIAMDAQRIERVVANLLSNAIKFTPAGGTITLRASLDERTLTCEIQDSGVGIAGDEQPRLFQRFSQLEPGRRVHGGTGLGLSISKAIVEAHGGTIGVRSQLGEGATFWFALPRRRNSH